MRFAERITSIILAMLFVVVLFPVFAKAASLEVRLSVDTFIEPGSVDVNLTVYNDSSAPMTDVTITAADKNYPLSGITIQAGKSQSFEINNFYVSEEQIGKDIEFVMKWKENGQSKSETVNVPTYDGREPVPDPTVAPYVELVTFTCSAANPGAQPGEKVALTYNIKNASPDTITNVTIIDTMLSDAPIMSGKTIGAGDTYRFTYDYKMGDSNITTSPILTYESPNGIKSVRGDALTIESVTVDMDVNVTRKKPTNDGTEFVINIANNGNKPITGIQVFDIEGKVLESWFNLGTSETKDLSYMINPKGKQEVKFTITGTLATGEAYKFESETYTVWEYIDPTTIGIKFSVEVEKALDKDGYATLVFKANNKGSTAMKNLAISDKESGRIGVLKDLVGGGNDEVSLTLYLKEAKDMTFTLTANAPTGEPYEYTVTVSAQSISLGSQAGLVKTGNENALNVGSAVSKVMKRLLTVLSILLFVIGAALIVVALFERQRKLVLEDNDDND